MPVSGNTVPETKESRTRIGTGSVARLRSLAIRGLGRMYRPDERLFAFRVRRTKAGIVSEGLSWRYTAIVLIGLAEEEETATSFVLAGHGLHDVCGRLIGEIGRVNNIGDAGLILWAARAVGYPDRLSAWKRLRELCPAEAVHPLVEAAWALAALCIDSEAPVGDIRELLARRLISSFRTRSGLFPHMVGGDRPGLRSNISCFADQVYPIHALVNYFMLSGNREALDLASRCAHQVCCLQGPAGQWWWHYDCRTGDVVEPYPVYAVHQDAMAPMALFSLEEIAGVDFSLAIGNGLAWLANAPELDGGSLVDDHAGLIWRKVGRREPMKLSRFLQAAASRLHPALRVPGLDRLFPPRAVDYEDRPYHLGWLLYAWPPHRVVRWGARTRTP